MIVWVQLPALKVHFYHKEVLHMLGNLIGRTIKLDYHTLTQQRAKFARLAVEVDLSKPLVPRIWLDDEWQAVEYENIPTACFECGRIGHVSAACPLLQPTTSPVKAVQGLQTSPTATAEEQPGFGPWMLVTRKSRRNSRDSTVKGKTEISSNGQMGKTGKEVAMIKGGDNLPNKDAVIISRNDRSGGQEKKGRSGNKTGGDSRKGKEKMGSEPALEKGLLGPGPAVKTRPGTGPSAAPINTPGSASDRDMGLLGRDEPNPESPKRDPGSPAQTLVSGPGSSSPLVHVRQGPNGTSLQIIEVRPRSSSSKNEAEALSPSARSRTKKNKIDKNRQPKPSPSKLKSRKPLQVWSPVKDRKPKSKSRMATLTLQEISAWTEAKNQKTREFGAGNPAVSASELPSPTRQDATAASADNNQ
ncbi:unnamed protein product [Linum tenue]|uniref:CCHC-type domain-containing protein n=1 Tax=Linum tenue TaxID=586396 RepID=A0AAV0IKJ8_9ROSI|nr:unnamed protein product [Linum tenue]